jgi:hypothetical protein
MAGDGKGKSILEQLIEEAHQAGEKRGREGDFAVNLSTTDTDGTHTIEGIPMSQVGKGFLARFGITDEGEGQGGEGGQGEGGEGEGPPANPIRAYFGDAGKKKRAG